MADNRTPSPDKDPNGSGSSPWVKSLLIWVGILLGLVLFVQMVEGGRTPAQGMTYSDLLRRVDEGSVKQVVIGKDSIQGRLTNGEPFQTHSVGQNAELERRLIARGVEYTGQPEQQTSVWLLLLYQSLPFLLILCIALFVMR